MSEESKTTYQDLVKEFESKRTQLKKEKIEKNPDGRYTGQQLMVMRNLIAGVQFEAHGDDVRMRKVGGLGDIKGDGYDSFKSKLARNLRFISNELEILMGILPEIPSQVSEQQTEYRQKKKKIARENVNSSVKYEDAPTEAQIEACGNISLYRAQLRQLDEEYQEMHDAIEQINEEREERFDKPLGKCDFDMIHAEEIPPQVSVNERMIIAPMLYDDLDAPREEQPGDPQKEQE